VFFGFYKLHRQNRELLLMAAQIFAVTNQAAAQKIGKCCIYAMPPSPEE
jgi:hypothetical protein